MYTAEYFISKLKMEQHIEGGYFKEIYRSPYCISPKNLKLNIEGERNLTSTIYFLLNETQTSKFHRIKFDEIWFYHYGSPTIIHILDNGNLLSKKLGLNIENGETPQVLVPANSIFGAELEQKNSFGLVSCLVSPGFDFRDFELFKTNDLVKSFPKHETIIKRINDKK